LSNQVLENPKINLSLRILFFLWGLVVLFFWLWIGWRIPYKPGISTPASGIDPQLPLSQLRTIAGFVVTFLTTLSWGVVFTRLTSLNISENKVQTFILYYLIGSIVHSLIIFLIGILQLFPFGLILPVFGNLIWFRILKKNQIKDALNLRSIHLYVIPILLLGLFTFISGLYPPVESDGLRYHLFGPQEFLKRGGIEYIPHNAFTNLPFQTQMLNTMGIWIGGYSTGQVIHWSYFIILYLINLEIIKTIRSKRTEEENEPQENWTNHLIAFLATTPPVIVNISYWPFIDLSTVAFTMASLLFLITKNESDLFKKVLVVAIISGGIIGTKLTGLIPAFFNGLIIIFLAFRETDCALLKKLKVILLYGVVVFIPVSPYLIKNTILIGNPVYPAGYSVFGGEEWDPDTDEFYKGQRLKKGFGTSPKDILLSPLDITLRWSSYIVSESRPPLFENPVKERLLGPTSNGFEDQNPGPAFLILLPFALIFFGMLLYQKKYLLFLIIMLHLFGSWLIWIYTYQATRFAIPQLCLSILLGGALLLSLKSCFLRNFSLVFMGLVAALQVYWPVNYNLTTGRGYPFLTGLSLLNRESVLSQAFPQYNAIEWLNTLAEEGEKVLYIGIYRGTYAEYDLVSSDWFDRPIIYEEIKGTENNEELLESLQSQGIRYVLYDHGELQLYLPYFKSRFTDEQFERFVEFDQLLRQSKAISFQTPGVIVTDLEEVDLSLLETME